MARRHEIQLTGSNQLFGPEAVTVQELTAEEPREGLETEGWMRRHVDRSLRTQGHRSHVVDEAPGTDRSPALRGECSTHAHLSDLRFTALDDLDVVFGHARLLPTSTRTKVVNASRGHAS